MEKQFYQKVLENNNIDKEFMSKIWDYVTNASKFIPYNDIKEWIGFKQKKSIEDILKNDKYGFIEGTDYKIEKIKKENICKPINEIFLTAESFKCICLMSPSKEGQKFRKYFIEIEKSLKNSTIIENNLLDEKINKYKFDPNEFANKEILYLLHLKDNIYKFGITANLNERFKIHKSNLKYDYVVKCWDCINRTISKNVEDAVKLYTKYNKMVNKQYARETEIIETTDLEGLIKKFSAYVIHFTNEYKKEFRNQELEQKKELLDKMNNFILMIGDKGLNDNRQNLLNFLLNNDKNIEGIELNDSEIKIDAEDEFDEIDENDIINKSKQCSRCKAKKPLNEFKNESYEDKFFLQCLTCRLKESTNEMRMASKKIRHKDYREKHKNELSQNSKTRRKNIVALHDKNNITEITDDNKNTKIACYRCLNNKTLIQFGINERTGKLYVNCIECRNKRKEDPKLFDTVKRDTENRRNYYEKNKDQILQKQKINRDNKIKNMDSNSSCCNNCHRIKKNDEFDTNPKTNKLYTYCKTCRLKKKCNKINIEVV